ncbi:MAG: RDD family protein [Chitinophagaceae bacterium]|nr:RDD family protein [Chitinophagaceae bacterium]
MEENTQINLLADIESTHLVQASTGKRFANYIIDIITFYVAVFALGIILALISPAYIDWINNGNNSPGFRLVDRLIGLVMYGVFMGLVEAVTKGRSLGKLITRTRAVNQDGSTIAAGTAFLRGLSRAVPFEAFSALGSPSFPWHDKWTKTYVIDIKESTINES